MNRTQQGFTPVELLVIVAIVGIIAVSIGLPSIRSHRVQQLGEASSALVAELNRARSAAQRTSRNQTITWAATTITTTPSGGTARSVSLSNGVTLAGAPSAGVMYLAPYGELVTLGTSGWRFERVSPAGLHTAVDLIGIMGKPTRRAVVGISGALTPLP